MGCFAEDRLGLVFIGDAHHVTRVSSGKIQDRLPRQIRMYWDCLETNSC
jgi:hypothetical protein